MPKAAGENGNSVRSDKIQQNNIDHNNKTVGRYSARTVSDAEQSVAKVATGNDARQSELGKLQHARSITGTQRSTSVDSSDSGFSDMEDEALELLDVHDLAMLGDLLSPQDIKVFAGQFAGLKGDFFHIGDYLVEHVNVLVGKIQQRHLHESNVSNEVEPLVSLWNCLCSAALNHLLWSRDITLTPLVPEFKAKVDKCQRLQKERSKLVGQYLASRSNSVRRKAAKAQTNVETFKTNGYLPEINKLRQALCQQSDYEINRSVLLDAHEQLHAVLGSNARNIVAEVDKWVRNLLLNRTFTESGLKPSDIIH